MSSSSLLSSETVSTTWTFGTGLATDDFAADAFDAAGAFAAVDFTAGIFATGCFGAAAGGREEEVLAAGLADGNLGFGKSTTAQCTTRVMQASGSDCFQCKS